jgi:3-deoxy-manno-octulosonate cytidylyltransferase (CMP-KDO synthetase)
MKIIGIIPARYKSSRFPGKPLADIHGKPMVWWVYQNAIKANALSEVVVATEDMRIVDALEKYHIPTILTSDACFGGMDRAAEIARKFDADYYTVINGDEPLLSSEDIEKTIGVMDIGVDVGVLCYSIKNPIDIINTSVHKFALNDDNEVIYISRQAIPFPQTTVDYDIYKCIGVYTYTKESLEFFAATPPGRLEKIEGGDLLRFIEHRKILRTAITDRFSMSVDTSRDLEKVRKFLAPPPLPPPYAHSKHIKLVCIYFLSFIISSRIVAVR